MRLCVFLSGRKVCEERLEALAMMRCPFVISEDAKRPAGFGKECHNRGQALYYDEMAVKSIAAFSEISVIHTAECKTKIQRNQ